MTDSDRIRKRVRQITEVKQIEIRLVWDDERAVWMAYTDEIMSTVALKARDLAVEAPTIKEALAKIGDEIET